MNESASQAWLDALAAAHLLAVDPAGLGGACLTAGPGPVRDAWLGYLRGLLPEKTPFRRVPSGIEDDRLLGGVDLAATLQSGAIVVQRGVLAESDGGFVVLAMAERLGAGVAARIVDAMENRAVVLEREGLTRRLPTRFGVIALDEREAEEDGPPRKLAERLAFALDLRSVAPRDLHAEYDLLTPAEVVVARKALKAIAPPDEAILEALVAVAVRLGIAALTAPILALRAARAACALRGASRIDVEDAAMAVRLVLAPRATIAPTAQDDDEEASPPEPPPYADGEDEELPTPEQLSEMLIEAAAAALPDGLLEAHVGAAGRSAKAARGGAGKLQKQAKRGRRIGVRGGPWRGGDPLALVATLRAAAPWQRVRKAARTSAQAAPPVEVRRDDFRLHRFAERRESTVVFVVDASGSAALNRLAEAKGAVQLLLGEAYAQRTSAALIVFRGTAAELLLPPTRSLARAKALLSTLPGGGATPLADGLALAQTVAEAERRKGRDPLLVILSDGRANIARDGSVGRAAAMTQAQDFARGIAAAGLRSIFIDTSPRPGEEARTLAASLQAKLVALPYVQAGAVRDAVRAAI
jgi:magnesium chelatase subunit D